MPGTQYQKPARATQEIRPKKQPEIKGTGSVILKNKYTVRGALIGAASGFILAAYFNKNKLFGISLGSIAGGIAGNYYSKIEINVKKL